jgi:hypothetical protein
MLPTLALTALLFLGQSTGQSSTGAQNTSTAGTNNGSGTAASKKKKVIRLDAITVEGRIQKPQAFYILQRSNLNFDELNRDESFLPKVVKSVDKEPF